MSNSNQPKPSPVPPPGKPGKGGPKPLDNDKPPQTRIALGASSAAV
jgi:hypothetical protein